jgi:hypothetical protein
MPSSAHGSNIKKQSAMIALPPPAPINVLMPSSAHGWNIRKQVARNTNHPIESKELHNDDTVPYFIQSARVTHISGMQLTKITTDATQYMALNISKRNECDVSLMYQLHNMTT